MAAGVSREQLQLQCHGFQMTCFCEMTQEGLHGPEAGTGPYLAGVLGGVRAAARVRSGIVHFYESQPRRAGAQIQVHLVLGMPHSSIDQPLVPPVPVRPLVMPCCLPTDRSSRAGLPWSGHVAASTRHATGYGLPCWIQVCCPVGGIGSNHAVQPKQRRKQEAPWGSCKQASREQLSATASVSAFAGTEANLCLGASEPA